jgi:hypothetical protein
VYNRGYRTLFFNAYRHHRFSVSHNKRIRPPGLNIGRKDFSIYNR